MVNIESLLVSHLNGPAGVAGVDAFMDVPETRPAKFVTVERTGGGIDTFRDLPAVAVQVWAESRYAASELAPDVVAAVELVKLHPKVARVNISSIYNFPDPDSRQARYQFTVELVTKDD